MPGRDPAATPAKYIYVARNPKDVAVSIYFHCLRFKCYEFTGNWETFFELYIKGDVDYGLWCDHVLEWWKHKGMLLLIGTVKPDVKYILSIHFCNVPIGIKLYKSTSEMRTPLY